jgi:hypothetical protein
MERTEDIALKYWMKDFTSL